ncbi:MAG: trypsin-like peptidase domain-containing protein [Chloroflexota bacterium]
MAKNTLQEFSDALADAAERAGKSTVLVDARKRLPASGIAFAGDMILTADHVVERDDDLKVTLADGTTLAARLAGRDPGTDLAVLKLDSASAASAEVTQTPARVGQLVLSLGRPSTSGIEASLGTVSAINGPVRTGRGGMLEKYIRTDTISFPGFSGGPLVAADGSVLGINTSGLAHGTGLTIPADVAWKVADTLAKHGHIKRGYLGIRSQTVEIPAAAQGALKREQATGLLVMGVEKDSPATKGGLMVGDILVGIAGAATQHHDELFTRLSGDVVGKSTPIEVIRGGELKTVNVVVGER